MSVPPATATSEICVFVVAMFPYAVSTTGTATTFVTANIAVIKLDNISQGSYPTKWRLNALHHSRDTKNGKMPLLPI